MSYNPFAGNDNFSNSESDPDIIFSSDTSPHDTKYFNSNKINVGFECLCKKRFLCLARKDYEYK